AAGPELLHECRLLGGCVTGDAKATTGGNLPARWVIHTVGPVWHGGGGGEPELLASCPPRPPGIARELGAPTTPFPARSTGIYGCPVELAAQVALEAVSGHDLELVRFVLFTTDDHQAFTTVSSRGDY